MKKVLLISFSFITFSVCPNSYLKAQGVGVNPSGSSSHHSAGLDVDFNDRGILIPRLTTLQRDAILNPAEALMIYNTTTKCFEAYNGVWQQIYCLCTPPVATTSATHSPSPTQIIWKWHSVSSATGYKYNSVNDYSTATDVGSDTTFTQTGLSCNTNYTLYVWAYNLCSNSPVRILTQSTNGTIPAAPTSGTNVVSSSQITWNWNTASGATGYKWNTSNDYNSATDNGTDTSYAQSGLGSCTDYTLYVWSYNDCGPSATYITLTGATNNAPGTTIVQFTTVGITSWTAPSGISSVEVLVVAGGGGGGYNRGGGGGAGGLIYNSSYSVITGNSYNVTVGGGGGPTSNGSNSSFDALVAIGGGAAGTDGSHNGKDGGSGGGGEGNGGNASGGNGTPGQGNNGGTANDVSVSTGGGGGGAGSAGGNGHTSQDIGGTGGAGLANSISGTTVYYAGGGGGGVYPSNGTPGAGGIGGGGSGGAGNSSPGNDGTPNTGGGAGGGGNSSGGGSGGSGIVIIRYAGGGSLTVSAGSNSPICEGSTLNLSASNISGAAYSWSGPNSFSSTAQNPGISGVTMTANGTYTVTATRAGCTLTASTTASIITTTLSAPVAGSHTSSPTQVDWNWSSVSGATGYKYNTTNDYGTATDIGNNTSYTQAGLACNTLYTLYVWAYNSCANSSPAILTQTTSGSLPSAPTAGTHSPSNNQIVWNWNAASGATGYKYNTINDYSSATDNGNNTSYTQTGLTANTLYSLYVWSYNVCGPSASPVTLTETTTALPQIVQFTSNSNWTVPSGVTSINVKMWGGGGGGNSGYSTSSGGGGGYSGGTIAVIPGDQLNIIIGGGGQSTTTYRAGGGGGGGTALLNQSNVPLIIAGGGGGSGDGASSGGGAGGGSSGMPGDGGCGGDPGTQSGPASQKGCSRRTGAGGNGINGGGGNTGSPYTSGGSGYGNGGVGTYNGGDAGSGGGGGGYYGGGEGGGDSSGYGGGGGSGYIGGPGVSNATTTSGYGATPGNNSDPDRNGAGQGGTAPQNGADGLVIIIY